MIYFHTSFFQVSITNLYFLLFLVTPIVANKDECCSCVNSAECCVGILFKIILGFLVEIGRGTSNDYDFIVYLYKQSFINLPADICAVFQI